jgi:hypothetical protein
MENKVSVERGDLWIEYRGVGTVRLRSKMEGFNNRGERALTNTVLY